MTLLNAAGVAPTTPPGTGSVLSVSHSRLFSWEAPCGPAVLAQWQARLEELVPRSDALSWLKIVWEPGDHWQPIQRYFLWQMRSAKDTAPHIKDALEGPSPRSTGHYCGEGKDPRTGREYCFCPYKRGRWVGGASKGIDRMTWQLYRETGCYGQRWWVIQGAHGGHRYMLDHWERLAFKVNGRPETDVPDAGDLAYAEPDDRLYRMLASYDKVRHWKKQMAFVANPLNRIEAEDREKAEASAYATMRWIDAQMGEFVQDAGSALKREMQQYRFGGNDRPKPIDEEAVTRSFIANHAA